jgi:hypothetical protein
MILYFYNLKFKFVKSNIYYMIIKEITLNDDLPAYYSKKSWNIKKYKYLKL